MLYIESSGTYQPDLPPNFMKIFNGIFCFLFIVFAALQYNDADPYIWIPLYLYSALLCGAAVAGRYYPKAYLSGIVVYAAYAVYKVFDENGLLDWLNLHDAENLAETMKAGKPWIEESREFFGLVLLITVMLVNLIASKRRQDNRANSATR